MQLRRAGWPRRILILCGLIAAAGSYLPMGHAAPAPLQSSVDVVVFGSEPEGIAAAVAAAEQGARTLLISEDDIAGGIFTLEKLNFLDLQPLPDHRIHINGFFARFYAAMGRRCATFSPRRAEEFFRRVLASTPNLTVWMNTRLESVVRPGGRLERVRVLRNGSGTEVTAEEFVDASRLGILARSARAGYWIGEDDLGRATRMGDTLVIEVAGIETTKLRALVPRFGKVDSCGAWGFRQVTRQYRPSESGRFSLRGLNIGWESSGDGWLNGLIVVDGDSLSADSERASYHDAVAESERLLKFLRARLPGFSSAGLVDRAPRLYLREGIHIKTDYILSLSDVLLDRTFPDGIAVGSYPVDRQASAGEAGTVYGVPGAYVIPLRSLLPEGIDNLLVVGRIAGYSSLAYGSARVVPTGMATGEAAGVVAAAARAQAEPLIALDRDPEFLAQVRQTLRLRRAWIDPPLLPHPPLLAQIPAGYPIPAITWALDRGLLAGGYGNNFHLLERVTPDAVYNRYCLAYRATFRRACPSTDANGGSVSPATLMGQLLWWKQERVRSRVQQPVTLADLVWWLADRFRAAHP